jgi:hypothetical protein
LLEIILPKETSFENIEIEHDFPVIGHRKRGEIEMKKAISLAEKENHNNQMRQDAEDKLALAKGSSLQMK